MKNKKLKIISLTTTVTFILATVLINPKKTHSTNNIPMQNLNRNSPTSSTSTPTPINSRRNALILAGVTTGLAVTAGLGVGLGLGLKKKFSTVGPGGGSDGETGGGSGGGTDGGSGSGTGGESNKEFNTELYTTVYNYNRFEEPVEPNNWFTTKSDVKLKKSSKDPSKVKLDFTIDKQKVKKLYPDFDPNAVIIRDQNGVQQPIKYIEEKNGKYYFESIRTFETEQNEPASRISSFMYNGDYGVPFLTIFSLSTSTDKSKEETPGEFTTSLNAHMQNFDKYGELLPTKDFFTKKGDVTIQRSNKDPLKAKLSFTIDKKIVEEIYPGFNPNNINMKNKDSDCTNIKFKGELEGKYSYEAICIFDLSSYGTIPDFGFNIHIGDNETPLLIIYSSDIY